MKASLRIQGVIASLGLLVGGLAAAPVAAQPTLRAISFIPKNHPVMAQARAWTDAVNAGLKGKLEVNYVGGSEVIDRFQQIEAVSNGVVDITFSPTADYQDRLPSVSTFTLSKLSPGEERKSGYYDWMVKRHERINVRYLGRIQMGAFYLWVNKRPETLADLKGLKMRTGSLYDRFMRKLGMVPVTMNSPEVYTALERGVVDGFGWPNIGPRQRGWIKKAKYVVNLPFFSASNLVALLNLDKWNSLPKDVQEKVIRITTEFEPKMVAYFTSLAENEWKELKKAGIVRVKFSDEENQRYLDLAYGVEWAHIAKRVPGDVEELKRLTGN